jgi:uncharacterized membrane protein YjgN (DUF898 family)
METPVETPILAPAETTIATPEKQNYTFEFKGTAGEYFRIWIVNIALTIVTLGIYSAWAKVRTRRYFDNHTFLAGTNFDYHGDPIKILKGRAFMTALFLLYSLGGKISPVIAGAIAIFFIAIFPWIIVRGMIFNLTNTSYRGIRFGFDGTYKDSYKTYFKSLLITIFTFGLGYPAAVEMRKKFQFNHSRFGTSPFRLNLKQTESFFSVYVKSVLIYFMVLVPFGIALIMTIKGNTQYATDHKTATGIQIIGLFYLAMVGAWSFIFAGVFNLLANALEIEDFKAKSVVGDLKLCGVYVTNFFACVFTLGLLYPWAKVRITKAKLGAIQLDGPAQGLDRFQAGDVKITGAAADAASDFLDIDLGF